MKTLHIVLTFSALLVAMTGEMHAQKVGTSSFQFLKVMPTARANAMGDAYSTLASGADAVFWNPAGLTTAQSHELATTLTLWLFDTKQSALAYALPIDGWGTFGAQLQYVDYGEIEETRADQLMFIGSGSDFHYNPGLTGRTFSPKAYVVGLSFARQLTDRFATGVTVKYVAESLWDQAVAQTPIDENYPLSESVNASAHRFLFDIGMRYDTGFRSIKLGISIQNLGAQVKYAVEEYPAPLSFRLGATANVIGHDALFFDDESNRMTIAYDIFQPNDYDQQMHMGIEYSFSEVFALRTGYKFNYDSDGLTFGGGVNTSLAGVGLSFDYSLGKMGEYLGNVHRLSLGVKFQ